MIRCLNIIFGFVSIIAFFSCASPGRPQGGPRDETPPTPAHSSPENFTTRFNAKNIVVKFDENIMLKNLNQQLTVSPPMAKPDITSNNRTLTIRLKDTLRENATYVISFGDALIDYNEGNILPNYQYVFSTGDVIDSLSVVGEVLDAYTLQPVEGAGLTLLTNLEDLNTKAIPPVYITKSNKEGFFHFNYLHEGCYFLAAIKDGNGDWVYDSLQEEVAFLSTCISPKTLIKPDFPDSCSTSDSLLIVDSIRNFYRSGHPLLMFKQELQQGIIKSEFTSNATIQVEFRNIVKQPNFQFLQPEITSEAYHIRWEKDQKNATIYLAERNVKNLLILVKDEGLMDTLNILNTKLDEPIAPLKVSLPGSLEFAFFDSLRLAFDVPVKEVRSSETPLLWLFSDTDTIALEKYEFNDSRTQLLFDVPLKQKTSYELFIPDSVFFNYFGEKNSDTLRLKFKTNTPESYAKLTIRLLNKPNNSCILQVLNEKLEFIEEQEMLTDSISFTTLKPGKYRLRLISDENKNKRWDSGNFRKQQFPEPVFIMPKILTLEANWEFEEEWSL